MLKNLIDFNLQQRSKDIPKIQSGDVVRVYRKIVEGEKERVQMFEGIVIAIKGGQSSSQMLTVRKVSNGIGVEIVVPLHSPMIEKIELVKHANVRKSKLYYIRNRSAKSLRMKYSDISEFARQEKEEKKEEAVEESKVEKEQEEVKNEQSEEKKEEKEVKETKKEQK